jgi:hypothetical protein
MRCRVAMIGLLVMTPFAASVGWWLTPQPRINAAACERIREGMTLNEVEEILGELGCGDEIQGDYPAMWVDGGDAILIYFSNDRVSGKRFVHTTLWQRMGDWYYGRTRYPDESVAKRLEAAA